MIRIAKVLVLVALAAAFVLPGIAQAGQQDWPAKIRIGYIPVEGAANVKERFKDLNDHIAKVLGVEVEAFSASDYAGIITAMANKHIDFAYYGPKSYTDASVKANAQALVMELDESGQPGYLGVIITNKKSGIKSMEEAKGHTFAFTDPNSTSGYLVPNMLFYRDMEIKPEEYFSDVRFSGSHGASILLVANNDIDVAATNNIDLARAIESGNISEDDYNILWTSDLIPGAPYCARADLPESLKAAYMGAMLMYNTNKEGLKKLGVSGYRYSEDSIYDSVRYLKRLKAELEKKQ
ncbi:phosphonate ABC transporter substrate-binding protein [Oceanidesulfovibrio marinus]|uniref:Phosphonate ABC transporter substrate-binding protein n=1 Tax=Oceanidesulfovibrio marinus TaxID=370038 RepID=A0A6P1ZC41_9BACT|nr:phosphonate ABC transporter substrate-binding protein [Oceanidesulfovibrio marinus]QJT11122.1 phosphonate ABC transporter substrate-binding protein [Oceanidesulfovibrio marinus]TVM31708.1 phosphonate ABC transporter substrate-binding protein [Oceanidesulfovibrio marinus]